ncbi:MAG: FlxA-like family protein [Proteobacteria bacterium]|nr:FlxA-like family protein [Pseudomonadota bacterium]
MSAISLGSLFDAALAPFTLRKEQVPAVAEVEQQPTTTPMQDYIVELSDAARKLAESDNPFTKTLQSAGLGGGSNDESVDQGASLSDQLQERIQQLQEEISEIQASDLPDEEKQNQLALKQAELAQLQMQLQEVYKDQQSTAAMVGGSGFMNTGSLT